MTKRNESKEQFRNRILNAAKELFQTQGYETTTIVQIAREANVGLGTAYNYFKSKEELYILSMADSFEEAADSKMEVEIEGDPAEIIYHAIVNRIGKMNWTNKTIWKIAFPAILSSMRSHKLPITEVLRADFKMIEDIRDLINRMKIYGMLDAHFDVESANDLVFSTLFYHLSLYVYSDEQSFDEVLTIVRLRIEYIFRNK